MSVEAKKYSRDFDLAPDPEPGFKFMDIDDLLDHAIYKKSPDKGEQADQNEDVQFPEANEESVDPYYAEIDEDEPDEDVERKSCPKLVSLCAFSELNGDKDLSFEGKHPQVTIHSAVEKIMKAYGVPENEIKVDEQDEIDFAWLIAAHHTDGHARGMYHNSLLLSVRSNHNTN
jgi:hypothetical protein